MNKKITKMANFLLEEGYKVTISYLVNDDEYFIQMVDKEYKDDCSISYIRYIFFNKKGKITDISLNFLDICNEKLLKEIQKSNKKIRRLLKNYNKGV